jgi:anti-anti-sigma factor
MATDFSISLEPPWNGVHVVLVAGEIDLAVIGEVARLLAQLRGRVCVDCSELRFIDAVGIGCLLEAAARLESLQLIHVTPPVRRAIEATDTTSLLGPEHLPVSRIKERSASC